MPEVGASLDDKWEYLLSADIRPHACKLLYAEEWAESIRESHADSPAREAALQMYHHEILLIHKSLGHLADVLLDPLAMPQGSPQWM